MNKTIISTAASLGLLTVILGAFGAHGLKNLVDYDAVTTFETGVRYQMYHVFFLLYIGIVNFLTDAQKKSIFIATLIGILLFSGSIYGLATNAVTSFDFKTIGFVTPIGGIFFIIAWGLLLKATISLKN